MQKFIFPISFILLFSIISFNPFFKTIKLDPRAIQKIAEIAREKAESTLIASMKTKFVTVASVVDKSKLAFVGSLGIPSHAVKKFVTARFTKGMTTASFNLELFPDRVTVIQGLGVLEIEGDRAKIAYVEASTVGKVNEQKEKVQLKQCRKILGFFEKCWLVEQEVVRDFSVKELEIIKNAVRAQSAKELKGRIEKVMELQAIE